MSLGRRAFKLVYLAWYRLLFGRRFPGSERLARRVLAWEQATGRGDAPAPREIWEGEYRRGKWELMRNELARYSVIAAYVHRLSPGGSVLDVGAGEGLLVDHLRPLGYGRYVGIDLAEAAVEQAQARADETTRFVATDAETFQPQGLWDVVVLNECIYYFTDPLATVARYKSFLAPGGALVVSTFRSRRADAIGRRLLAAHALVEETTISNRKGTWVVRVLQ